MSKKLFNIALSADLDTKENGFVAGVATATGETTDGRGLILEGKGLREAVGKSVPFMQDHMNSTSNIIGKATFTEFTKDGLLLFEATLNMASPTVQTDIYPLFKMGAIPGVSIGFYATEWTEDETTEVLTVKNMEIYELSIVTDPAVDRAKITDVLATKNNNNNCKEGSMPELTKELLASVLDEALQKQNVQTAKKEELETQKVEVDTLKAENAEIKEKLAAQEKSIAEAKEADEKRVGELEATVAKLSTVKKDSTELSSHMQDFKTWAEGCHNTTGTEQGETALKALRGKQAELSAAGTWINEEGGLLVPDEVATQIKKRIVEVSGLNKLFTNVNMGLRRSFPVQNGIPYAFLAEEGGCVPTTGISLGSQKLETRRRCVNTTSTFELLNFSSGNYASILSQGAGEAFAVREDYEIMRGVKALGEYDGLLTSDVINPITTTAAGKFSADDIIQMQYGFKNGASSSGLVYIMHRRTVGVVKTLKDNNGQYLFRESMTELGTYATFNGIPVIIVGDVTVIDETKRQAASSFDAKTMVKSVPLADVPTSGDTYATGAVPIVLLDPKYTMTIGTTAAMFIADDKRNVDVCGLTRNIAWHAFKGNKIFNSDRAAKLVIK